MSISGPPFSQYLWQCAQSPEEKPGTFFPDWAYNLKAFIPGAIVAVDKRSNLKHCHATVVTDISLCCGLGEDELCKALSTFKHPRREGEWMGDDPGRLLLEFSEAVRGYISVSRLTRVLPCSPARVLIVNETVSYRRLAKTQVGKVDGVLEIGSSFGECTQILTKHAAAVIGIDNSQELVEESRRRYPFCRIELLNCFQDPLQLQRLCSQLQDRCENFKIFVDIGGERSSTAVCRILVLLDEVVRGSLCAPCLVVVKCKSLSAAAAASCDERATICILGLKRQTFLLITLC
ncbi:unnamed protein product [Durusdinium trenchii]|uniref:Uncharacterized protein n=2 Tax=Durusdinium trenchii TaxID=1381693 RepID=A0ABP0MY24_9DINO